MRIIDPILQELEQESATTKRVLDRVPGDKLDWKPHDKSFSLGQLAFHVASSPASISEMISVDEFPIPDSFDQDAPTSLEQIHTAWQEGLSTINTVLNDMDDGTARSTWKATKNGNTIMEIPKVAVARVLLLNHMYHHRGQLTVYLRLLDIPVPSTYGPSADENPFDM